MKLRRNKKGFTIVELVIVIAVIGVLAAVLIPTFINLTDKANKAADDSLVKNLNTALATQEGVPGDTKNNTLHEAVIELEEYGYKLPNLVTKSGENSLLWNRKTNRFLLEKDIAADKSANKTVDVDYFHIQDNIPSGQKYSVYAGNGFNESAPVNVGVGFDVGFKTFSEINYSHTSGDGQEVVIRTNGEDLKIDGEGDVVRHYGKAKSLSIIAVANQSYHENGKVSFVEISKGRIVLEQESEVKHIHVNAIAPVNPEAKATAFEEIIIAKAQQVEMPVLSRDDVEIGAQGTKVVALQEGTAKEANKDYVWLTKQGIYEQIKVSDSATSAGDVWVNTSSKSDETKNAAQQIANNIGETATVGSQEYTVTVNEDREIVLKDDQDQVAYTITADEDGNTVIKDATSTPVTEDIAEQVEKGSVEQLPDKEDVEKGATLFDGGTGSQKDPFIIYDYETMQNISKLYNEGFYYYEVNLAKTDNGKIDCTNWNSIKMCGSFDGKGVVFNNVSDALFECVVGTDADDAYVKSFTITNGYMVRTGYYEAPVISWTENLNQILIDNVKVSGYAEATIVSSFVGWSEAKTTLITNCESSLTLVSTGSQVSGFVGNSAGVNNVTVIDSQFIGSEASTANSGQYLYAHNNSNASLSLSYTDEYKNAHSNLYPEFTNKGTQVNPYSVYSKLSKQALTIPSEVGVTLTVNKDTSAVKAVATYVIGVNPGNYTRVYQRDEIDLSNIISDEFNTSSVKKYNIVINDGIHGNEAVGNTQYIKDSECNGTYHCIVFTVIQYDSTGSITSIRTTSLPGND